MQCARMGNPNRHSQLAGTFLPKFGRHFFVFHSWSREWISGSHLEKYGYRKGLSKKWLSWIRDIHPLRQCIMCLTTYCGFGCICVSGIAYSRLLIAHFIRCELTALFDSKVVLFVDLSRLKYMTQIWNIMHQVYVSWKGYQNFFHVKLWNCTYSTYYLLW
jgi:hypothetical protein